MEPLLNYYKSLPTIAVVVTCILAGICIVFAIWMRVQKEYKMALKISIIGFLFSLFPHLAIILSKLLTISHNTLLSEFGSGLTLIFTLLMLAFVLNIAIFMQKKFGKNTKTK
ncbi:hypothetical protein [Priestia endophytica]|uniref:Uncharacterized protein n=1 Tax=Priestia endophytica DSM 13796 TaxID=1121089 RepID=A0A1I6C7H9_9BACI|nr:hypothetical protein [Priestia endophytica]KYG33485.1 hypothetical protein AZF06_21825 [Priestia endophytica]SFQ89094.1 hypothetical protein SAMN02745910_05199 [Priestia endophytica DSM 13796]